jgi:hypothetical protein
MQITGYEFGRIEIDGLTYNADVIIAPDGIRSPWWRKEGHNLQLEDLSAILAAKPEVLLVGTGYYGRMKVPAEIRSYLEKQGMELRVSDTREAVRAFNALQQDAARVVAALHLTC